MAAADVSALIDVVSAPDAPVPTTPQPASTSPTPMPSEPEANDAEITEPETETTDEGEGATEEAVGEEKPVDGRTNPAAIRKALKEFRDSKPENAAVARELNNAYGRYTAYKSVFPKVADAQNAKAILDAVGGNEGVAQLQSTIKSVNETDALLYAGDPRVLDSIIEDMKAENKLDAFGKLAKPFLEKLRGVDDKAYYETMRPHFLQGLVDVNLPGVLQSLTKALTGETPDINAARSILTEMSSWFDNLRNSVETADKTKLDPEREAFEKERTQFQSERQKAFEAEVNGDWNRINANELGRALKQYTKLPFAKNWTDATKLSVAREIMSTLGDELKNDSTYQAQMDAFWSEKQPDRKKIAGFHEAKLKAISNRIVKSVLDARYPGFQKAAGTARPKATGAPVAPATGSASGSPTFVTSKPDGSQIDWVKDPTRMLFTTGKAYLKNGKFVTWKAGARR